MHLVFSQYMERLNRLQAKPRTLRNVERTAVLLGDIDLAKAQDWELEEWLAGLPHAPRTKKLHLENVRAACRYARRRGTIDRDPTEYVKLARVDDVEPRIIPNADLRRLKARCVSDQQTLMFHLFAYTGMRRNEVINLTWDDVGSDTILVRYGKGGKLRNVPIHPALGEVLTEVPRRPGEIVLPGRTGNPLWEASFYYRLKKLTGELDIRTHDFRRTVTSSLYGNGVPTDAIDRILGWAPREVRSRYYTNIAATQLQEAILRLYADDPV